jgi:ion channel POLLUX/CASTOR
MNKNTFGQKMKYRFDNFISKGSLRILYGLGIFSLVGVIIVAVVALFMNMDPAKNIFDLMWMSLMATFQSNSVPFVPGQGHEEATGFIVPMLLVTILGFVVVSVVIGAITNGIQSKVESLKKGRSLVIEKGHIVVLGWSEQVITIVSELAIAANDIKKKACVVIMGNKDKVEMEHTIKDKVGDTGKLRVVCRKGNPMEMTDLKIVNLNNAKSILLVSPDDSNDPDSSIIKTLLAITKNPKRKCSPYNIIAEMINPEKAELAKIVGKDEIEVVQIIDFISRIFAQTCRQNGLSVVYTELMDFGGVEIYFKKEPSLVGLKFEDILNKYDDSVIMGLFDDEKRISKINPPMNTVLQEKDLVIAISENEYSIKLSGKKESEIEIDTNLITIKKNDPIAPENLLILGWNRKICKISSELDKYAPQHSTLTIVADYAEGEKIIADRCSNLKNIKVSYLNKDTTDRKTLDDLMNYKYDHVILLCYEFLGIQEADAKTLVTLLHLRDIKEKRQIDFSIVSEMLDIRNRNLAESEKVNDFVVSGRLVSLLMTQLSENKYLNMIFEDIFDAEGSEIYIKPASDYIKLNTPVNFYTITKAAAQKNEVAIGYKIDKDADVVLEDNEKGHGIVIDPLKTNKITFTEKDRIIVLAEYQVC